MISKTSDLLPNKQDFALVVSIPPAIRILNILTFIRQSSHSFEVLSSPYMRYLNATAVLLLLAGCQTIQPEAIQKLEQKIDAQTQTIAKQQSLLASVSAELNALRERSIDLQAKVDLADASQRKTKLSSKPPQALTSVRAKTDDHAGQGQTVSPIAAQAKEALDSSDNNPDRVTVGRLERVELPDLKLSLDARMDTGIHSSSISALDLQNFERDGNEWVRFRVEGHDQRFELPVLKYVKIKQAGVEKEARRPVVQLRLKIGSLEETTSFTLVNRSNLSLPAVIGRAFLQDYALVDVAASYLQSTP